MAKLTISLIMRELLFRAYHKQTGVMYFFDLMWGNFKSGGGYIGMSETNDWNNRTFVDPHECEIMQYTGLNDKNGNGIYEGDIIQELGNNFQILFGDFETDQCTCIGFYYNDGHPFGKPYSNSQIGEVIGNIHQNPELL